MKVKITNMVTVRVGTRSTTDWVEYVTESRGQCRGEVDQKVFDLVVQHNDVIKMGCVIGEPVAE